MKSSFIVISIAIIFGSTTLRAQSGVVSPRAQKEPLAGEVGDLINEARGKTLRWKLERGEILELKKFSDQMVKTGKNVMKRTVFHRVLLENREIDFVKGYLLEGEFISLIRNIKNQTAYREDERFTSQFYLKPNGEFDVDKMQYMPNVRSVPSFPLDRDPNLTEDRKLEPGMTWDAPGEEAMKFSQQIRVPFTVHYEYRGLENVNTAEGDRQFHKFISNYELNYGDPEGTGPRVFGYVTAVWFWDQEKGIPYFSQEEYNVIIVNEAGVANEFKIKSKSYYKKYRIRNAADKENIITDLKKILDEKSNDKPASVEVKKTELGVTIEMADILFDVDSADLSSEAKRTLRKNAEYLNDHKDTPVLVQGHTDNTGGAAYNQKLSENRAQAVADYLLDKSDVSADQITYEGKGEKKPISDNSTPHGRKKNRRVEIILLDK